MIDADAWFFVHLKSGAACWIDTRTPCLLTAGDTLVVPPGLPGVIRASVLAVSAVVYFRFCPDLLAGFLTLAERVQAERSAGERRGRARIFPTNHALSREFALFCEFKGDKNSALARSRLLQIAVQVVTQSELAPVDDESAFLSASKRAHLLFRQLSEVELLESLPDDLARRCGCSVRHFNKLFRSHFGISLRTRQLELKLAKARQLLAETNMQVIEIATATGFREQGMFSSAFKRRFGMTPSEWRRDCTASPRASQIPAQRNGSS
jgi:AraC-like DNA-binding protein